MRKENHVIEVDALNEDRQMTVKVIFNSFFKKIDYF